MNKGTLYLIPTPIGKQKENRVLPEHTLEMVRSIRQFVVEKPQTTQSFLQWVKHPVPDYELTFRVLNKKTPDQELFSFMKLLDEGDVGLMSEAGAPGVADPGAKLVKLAHDNEVSVVPLVGPSAILMSLMASGLNGQKFAFHGYLPIREQDRNRTLSELETESYRQDQTQIFMETPHRNEQLFSLLLSRLKPETRLCVACNITMPDEMINCMPVHRWKSTPKPDLQRKPALFLIGK